MYSGTGHTTVLRRARRLVGRSARFLVAKAPVETFRRRPNHHYVPDLYGHSAYKDIDILEVPIFGQLAQQAVDEGRTLLYFDKLYTIFQAIWNLSRLPGETAGMTIADVGTYRGGGAHFMASCAEALGVRRLVLHCFDTFAGHQQEDIHPEFEASQEEGRRQGRYRDVSADEVRRYLSRFPGTVVHAGRFHETAPNVAAETFDLVHVDINLYEPTSFALSFFDKRLSEHGVIIVDDYGSTTNPGVHLAVNQFVEGHGDYVRFHLLTNQCLLFRRPGGANDV